MHGFCFPISLIIVPTPCHNIQQAEPLHLSFWGFRRCPVPYFSENIDFYKKKFNLADVLKRFTPAAVYHDVHMYFYAELFGRGDDLFD